MCDFSEIDPENLGNNTNQNLSFYYIALEDVDMGKLTSFSEQVFYSAPSRARRKLRHNDILVSTVRPNLMSHMLFSSKVMGGVWVCSTGFSVVRCIDGMAYPAFVYQHFFASLINKQINQIITGSNYPAINGKDVRNLEILMPKYDEQVMIGNLLSDMDKELETLESKLAKARYLKQGMMQQLLTGRIRLI